MELDPFEQLSTLGRRITFGNLDANLCVILSQPDFLLVKHRNRVLYEFLCGSIRTALDILLDYVSDFGSKANFHA